jgi:hydrogenase maturation protease
MRSAAGRARVLVAGVGNVFLGDDGFGVEVVRRLGSASLPANVDVADYGIRGVHLAYDLLDGRHDTLILVDAVPMGEAPGALALMEALVEEASPDSADGAVVDGHGMDPRAVLALLHTLGGDVGRVLVVGCQPARLDEGMGLSDPVAAALDDAVRLVADLASQESMRPTTPARVEAR